MKKVTRLLAVGIGALTLVVAYHFYSEQNLNRRVKQAEETVGRHATQISETKADVKNHQQRIEVLETQLEETGQRLSVTQEKLKAQEEKIGQLDASRQKDRGQLDDLRQDFKTLQELHIRLQGEHEFLTEEVSKEDESKKSFEARLDAIERKIGLSPES